MSVSVICGMDAERVLLVSGFTEEVHVLIGYDVSVFLNCAQAAALRDKLTAHLEAVGRKPVPKSQGACETTSTERFHNPDCVCPTYIGNLGPCAAHERGENGRCVYCDHELTCKPPAAPIAEPPELHGPTYQRCDACGSVELTAENYCPSCGASYGIAAKLASLIAEPEMADEAQVVPHAAPHGPGYCGDPDCGYCAPF